MKKIHIQSKGSLETTVISNAHTGEKLQNVTQLGIFVDAVQEEVRAHLVMIQPSFEMMAEVEQLDAAWIDIRRGGMMPFYDQFVWVATMGSVVDLAQYRDGTFYVYDKEAKDVSHWQPAFIPPHPTDEEFSRYQF